MLSNISATELGPQPEENTSRFRVHPETPYKETIIPILEQEGQYQESVKKLEKSGKVEKITLEEPGCERLIVYRIGEPDVVINSHIHGDEPGPAIPLLSI